MADVDADDWTLAGQLATTMRQLVRAGGSGWVGGIRC
jgi:hypothetical protein